MPTDPILQIVITKSPDGYNVILMTATHVTERSRYPTREHVLSSIADHLFELVEPTPQ